jgi:hypothetical protein
VFKVAQECQQAFCGDEDSALDLTGCTLRNGQYQSRGDVVDLRKSCTLIIEQVEIALYEARK